MLTDQELDALLTDATQQAAGDLAWQIDQSQFPASDFPSRSSYWLVGSSRLTAFGILTPRSCAKCSFAAKPGVPSSSLGERGSFVGAAGTATTSSRDSSTVFPTQYNDDGTRSYTEFTRAAIRSLSLSRRIEENSAKSLISRGTSPSKWRSQ